MRQISVALAGLSDIEATHADMQALDKARQATNAKNLAAKAREAEQRKGRIQKAHFMGSVTTNRRHPRTTLLEKTSRYKKKP